MRRWRAAFSHELAFVLLVGLFALCLRLGYNHFSVGAGYTPEFDAREYSEIAASLATGAGYSLADGTPTAIRPPLFPLLLAGIYRVWGVGNYAAGLTLEAVLGALLAVAGYGLARRLGGVWEARCASLILATYPLLVFAGGALLSEPLFVLLVTAAGGTALEALAGSRRFHYALTGVLLGLAWLARPNGATLLPFVAAWLLLADRRPVRSRLASLAWMIACALVVVAPWVARNAAVMGRFLPTSTMSGAVLFGANNELILADPALHGDWIAPCEVPGAGWTCSLDEIGRDQAWQALGIEFIRTHLPDLPRMMWWRFVKFWHLYPFEHGFPAVVGFYYYVAIALLAVLGCWQLRKRWRQAGLLWAVILCFMTSALLFWGGFRIRMPAEPALIVLAAFALGSLARGLRGAPRLQQES